MSISTKTSVKSNTLLVALRQVAINNYRVRPVWGEVWNPLPLPWAPERSDTGLSSVPALRREPGAGRRHPQGEFAPFWWGFPCLLQF